MMRKFLLPSLLAFALPVSAALVPATVTTTGGGATATELADKSMVVKFLADGTFTVPDGATGRLLVVAGGGGAGYDCSAGGGGGGVIETNDVVFPAGTYTVTVGAGGAHRTSAGGPGSNGGNTVLSFGGDDLHVAFGGGGGGSWSGNPGADGGCGGGAAQGSTPGKGVPGQGFDATKGSGPGAGGGAGGSPLAGTVGRGDGGKQQASGGPGRTNDITGTLEVYGPGGGAGGDNGRGGLGGDAAPDADGWLWGCGRTHANYENDAAMAAARKNPNGRAGYGGGGGGASNSNYNGGDGGSGVLIVRLDPVPAGPLPRLSVLDATDGPESASFRVRIITAGDDASSVSVSYAVATSVSALDAATPVEVGSDLAEDDIVSISISGLAAGTTYYVRFLAENDRGETAQSDDFECLPYVSTVSATATGAQRVFDVGRDRVAAFGASSETMTFALAERTAVELLLVGGGGGGGSYVGGGGGAGGFLHLENVVLDAGIYEISVGAGGAQATGSSLPGGDGGDTVLRVAGGGEVLFTAHGGGGGGGNYSAGQRAGRAGGSGGGAGNASSAAGASTASGAERGNPGGANDAAHRDWAIGSGGGGAGAPGTHADYANVVGGAGGDGLPCSITGEEVWYAGGGGAGQNYDAVGGYVFPAGRGGRGGGGMGCRSADNAVDDCERGADGLGGGGGGGRKEGTDGAGYSRRGAPGGSGTLIVRWRATSDATARATVDSVVGSVGGAIVSGSVQLAGSDSSGAALEMAVGPAGGALGAWQTLATGLGEGERFTLTLSGLAAGADYDYAVRVVSGGAAGDTLGAATGSFSTYLSAPATLAADPANAVKTTVGTDTVFSFSTPGTYTFTVSTRGRARFLMVGGGGAGGTSRGGGGGAGGFIERPATTFEAGTYTVVVGAGGAVNTAKEGAGGDGADTTLSLDGATLYTAHGGGGGGYGDSVKIPGRAGGSSGGAGPCSEVATAPTAVPPELGNPGGKGSGSTAGGYNSAAAGGGGAGGPGADGHSSDAASGTNRRQAGNGGPGVASDITGETLWYAGGGGGGTWYDGNGGYKGLGGSGVGGNGGGYTTEVNQGVTAPVAGADGTGSGGGGGVQYDKCSDAARRGAAGGCGAFVLRLAADESSDLPEVVLETLSAESTTARAVVALRNAGAAATADLSLAYGADPDALDLSAPVAVGAAPGVYSAAVSGLAPGRTWYFAPVASNAGGASTGAVASVALPAAGALPAGDGTSGLWQISRRATAAAFPGVFTNASIWADAQVSNVVAGALAADTAGYVFEDPATGLSYVWPGPPSLYAYRGWIYLEGGKTYVFGTRYADSVFVAVDGRTLVSVVKSAKTESFGTVETGESGWHEIEVRVGHVTENFGPDGDGGASWKSFGVAFNANGSTSPMPESGWTLLRDDGSGSLLRPFRPEARTISLVSQAVGNGSLALGAKVGSGERAAHAWLVYGDEDAGTASTNAWAHVVDLGEIAAADAATDLAAQVAGWGSAAFAARLVLETDGLLAWTQPVTYTATALPRVLDVVVSDYGLGDRATFRATVSGGVAPYAATLLVGTDADSLAAAATADLAAAGEFSFALSDLAPGTRHFFRFVVVDASGATARTEILSFATPGASRVYDFSDGNTSALWEAANPYENRQSTIRFGGTLSEYGAGETTVRLLRNQTYYGAPSQSVPGQKTTRPHEGEELVLPAAGAYVLPVRLDWDLDVAWNWSVSNATETLSWGPTSQLRDSQNWARYVTVVDATTYAWKGGDGLWTDAEKWTPDGVWDDVAGYPRRGSYATFPSGTNVVYVPDTALTNRFSKLTVPANAVVEFRSAPGAADATLRLQEEPYVSSGTRNYGFSQGKNSTLRFAGRGLHATFWWTGWAWYPGDAGTTLDFTDGVRAYLGNNSNNGCWSGNNKEGSVFSVRNGAEVTARGLLRVTGKDSQLVLDDATIVQPWYAGDTSGVMLAARSSTGKAAFVVRGASPSFKASRRFYACNTDSSDADQFVDFEVPEGGWAQAPIWTDPANAYTFGQGSSTSNGKQFAIHLRIPTNSPAVVAGESLDVPLVRWPAGFHATAVPLDTAYLPHPDTDSFFTTVDPVTGQPTLWAHLVGQSDTEAPQASDFRVRSLAQTAADLSFVVIPGSGAETAVSVAVLDANGDAVAGATATPSFAATTAFATNFVSVSGLEPATAYSLRVTLDDGSNPVVTTDFPFASLDDWGEGESDTADSVVQDGPYTVWTFTDTTPHAGVFTVTRAGLAELLVVGGGGAGGAGANGSTYGGGGGGGGQAIATNVVLVPGTYAIQVGKGGAKLTSRGVGADGAVSAFGDIVALGGGGGGYNAAGRPGASGGGGSNNKAGGAGSAGFAGGAGASNLAGGGGGGAGGAGADGASTFGGAGGAGSTNAISGYPAVYGAGGGGGSSGSYSAYKGGGAPGDETAGHGAEASFDGRKAAFVKAQNATPGFGGGGGGGCASSDGSDNSGILGGSGGSGTVVVRMRTATAADPAPQAALKAAEAGEADWTASLFVYSLGQGASAVSVELRAARDGAAETNAFPMGTVPATGAATRVATGLAPSSDYAGVLVLDNGLEGGTLEIPVAFRTADPAATTVPASSAWTFGQWTGSAADFHAANLLRGALPAATVASTGAAATEGNLVRVSNGDDDYFELYPDRRYEWTWDDPVYLVSFRAFYNSSDYRSGVNVGSVEALGSDGTWTAISPTPGHYNEKWGRNYGYLLPAPGADALWDEPAYGIRFTADGFATTSYHNFREVEAEGVPVADLPAGLSITSLSRTAAGVKALVSFSHPLQADATVTAFVGAVHGGTDASAWTSVATAQAEAGALAQNFSLAATALDGMVYLRFSYADANGAVRWSETVYLPDVEILDSIPPVVHYVATRETTPASATLAASLVDAGSGSSDGTADLYVRRATRPDGVDGAADVLFAGGAAEGETSATVDGLMPDRVHWARFSARNAGGDVGVSENFSFRTEPDVFPVRTVSEANLWDTGTWSANTVATEDNLLRGVVPVAAVGEYDSAGVPAKLTDGVVSTASGEHYAAGAGTTLTFELGGVFSLSEFRIYQYWNNQQQRTVTIASLEWRDEEGEWHRIPGSALDYDGGNQNRAFLRPADGAPFLAVGATAFRYTQGVGGTRSNHSIREMELFGAPSGAHRLLVVDEASWSGGTLSATVSRTMTNAVGTVRAASGAAYAGTNAAAWAATAVFGAFAEGQAAVSGSFAPASGARYVRFYETDEAGTVVAWSDTVPADPAALRVVDGGVEADGDLAFFPIRVVSAGTGTLSVKVVLADNPGFEDATEIAVEDPAAGPCSATARVEPGGTYWYRVVAETTDGGFDETPAASFSTRAGSRLAATVSTTGVSHRFATLQGTLETFGAGVTTVEILVGDSSDALEVFDTVVLDRAGSFWYPGTFPGRPRTIYFRFHAVNVAPGGTRWESWSNTGSFWTVDAVGYTWKKEVTEGAWNDPANWIPSAYPDTCTGYPDGGNTSVDFPDGTVATVTVPGKYRYNSWNVARSNLDLTFVGNGPEVSGLGTNNDNMSGGNWVNSSMTFSNLSLAEADGIYFGHPDTPGSSSGSTLRFTDGAVASFGNAITAAGSNMWIVVDGGATLAFRSNGPALEVKDGGIRLDGGTITGGRILTDYNWAVTTNQAILVSGAAPRIALTTSFRNSSAETKNLQNADTSFSFTVPKEGWAEPVVWSENEGDRFAGLLGDGPGRYVLGLDGESPAFKRAGDHVVQLVAWKGGVDTNHVVVLPAPEGAEIFWTYGWPSEAAAPAAAGDLPTGLRAVLHGTNLSVSKLEPFAEGVVATVSLDAFDSGAESASVSVEVSASPDGFADPDFVFAYAGNPVAEPGEFEIPVTGLVPATPYWIRAVVAPAGGGEASRSAVRPLASAGEGRIVFSHAGGTSLSARALLDAAGAGCAGAAVRLEASRTSDFSALCGASREARVGDGASERLTVENLETETSYWLRVRFENDRGFVFYAADSEARSTLADPLPRTKVYVPGLVQAKLSGYANWTTDVRTHDSAVCVPGAIMASVSANAFNPYNGTTYYWGREETWGYVGQMYMEGGRTYWFAKSFDDNAYAKVDGTALFANSSVGSFAVPETGWYDVDFRVSNNGGTAGPGSGTVGLGWNADGHSTIDSFKVAGLWSKILDPGDGSLLRALYSETPFMEIESVSSAGGVLSVTASFAGIPAGGGELVAFFGAADGGVDEDLWTSRAAVVSPVRVGDTASDTYEVPGGGDAAFVAFKLCGTDSSGAPWRQWSKTYPLAPERPSFRLESTLVAFTNLGWTVACTGVGDGASTVQAEVQISTEEDFSVTNQVVPFGWDGVGVEDAAFAGLETNRTYWVRVAGVNDRGEWGYSSTLSRKTLLPGPPVTAILHASTEFTSASWFATVNEFGFGGESAHVWVEVSASGDFEDAVPYGDVFADAEPFTTPEPIVTSGLEPGTTYHVRSHARNVWGVEGVSAPYEFTIRSEPFVMTDVGSVGGAGGKTTLMIECIQVEPGTVYFVTFNVDGSSIRSVGNLTQTGTFSATYTGEPGSTHEVVVAVEGRLGGRSYVRTYAATFVVGESAYAVASLDHLRSVPLHVGDKVVLPALATAQDHYALLGVRPFELLEDGRTLRALEPGFVAVAAFEYDPLQDAVVRNKTMGLAVCLPEPAGGGRVFLAERASGNWNWSQPRNWKNLTDPSDTASWPCLPDDVAIAPTANGQTLFVDADATVGQIYFGCDEKAIPGASDSSVRLAGSNGATLTFESTDKRSPALLRFCNLGNREVENVRPRVRFGNSSSGSTALGVRLGSDMEWDCGAYPDYTDVGIRSQFGRYLCGSDAMRFFDVPEGRTLVIDNVTGYKEGDTQGEKASFWMGSSTRFTGGGTIYYEGPASADVRNPFIPFSGVLVVRNKQPYDTFPFDARGGSFWMGKEVRSGVATNATMRIEGHAGWNNGLSLAASFGVVTWGNTHGFGSWGYSMNPWAEKAIVFNGGCLFQNAQANGDSSWRDPSKDVYGAPYKDEKGNWVSNVVFAASYCVPARSDKLVVADGLSSLYVAQTSGVTTPTNSIVFDALEHAGDGVIRIGSDRMYSSANSASSRVWRDRVVVRGFRDHAIGGAGLALATHGADPTNVLESTAAIVPWIATTIGSATSLRFPGAAEDGTLVVAGHPPIRSLDSVVDPLENVRSSGFSIALTHDVTVNSLVLEGDSRKGPDLGEGRTLTVSSGGLVLGAGDTAYHESVDTEAACTAGTRGTLYFPAKAYVWTARTRDDPNEIWARIVAPEGFVVSYPGKLLLGGDQTGIDGRISVNGSELRLGSATTGCRIDVPVHLFGGNSSVVIGKEGSFCRRELHFHDHGTLGSKFVALPGTVEKVGRTYVDGVNLKKGLYGSSESGADIVDDNHFAGTGLVRICVDERDKASMLILR